MKPYFPRRLTNWSNFFKYFSVSAPKGNGRLGKNLRCDPNSKENIWKLSLWELRIWSFPQLEIITHGAKSRPSCTTLFLVNCGLTMWVKWKFSTIVLETSVIWSLSPTRILEVGLPKKSTELWWTTMKRSNGSAMELGIPNLKEQKSLVSRFGSLLATNLRMVPNTNF